MPARDTVYRWIWENKEGFSDMYARAREIRADKMIEEILTISDDGLNDTYLDKDGNEKTDTEVIARSKLRVDSRKWLASKFAPRQYGERQAVELSGKDGGAIVVSEQDRAAKLAGLLALANARKEKAGEGEG